MRDARAHAGIGAEEGLHPVLVAGQDHHQVIALVLHHLQQDLDRFLAVVALVLGAVEVVGLVDEQHAAHGLLETSLVLGAVWPMYWPTRSSRVTATRWPLRT